MKKSLMVLAMILASASAQAGIVSMPRTMVSVSKPAVVMPKSVSAPQSMKTSNTMGRNVGSAMATTNTMTAATMAATAAVVAATAVNNSDTVVNTGAVVNSDGNELDDFIDCTDPENQENEDCQEDD